MAAALRKTPTRLRLSLPRLLFSTSTSAPDVPSESDPISRAKSAIRSESDPDRLADIFLSSLQSPQFHGDREIYRHSILKLSRARRLDLIERLLEPKPEPGSDNDPAAALPKSEGFLIRIITLYSDAGMLDHAVRAFARVAKPTERSLCALLTAFFKNRSFDRLLETFRRAPQDLQISPGVAAHNIVIHGLCEQGNFDAARKLLDEMAEKGRMPDLISYNTLLGGYLKKGEESGFKAVLAEIDSKGLTSNVTTYNCRIADLCSKGRSVEAEGILDLMVSKGVRANRTSFNTIIDGFCKEGDVTAAMRVFKRMPEAKKGYGNDGPSPNFETYMVLIHKLVEKGEFEPGLEVFKECVMRKWAPPFDSVKGLVEGLKKNARVNDAKYVAVKMRKAVKGDAVDAWKKVEGVLALLCHGNMTGPSVVEVGRSKLPVAYPVR